jgi:hypothetical protein
MAGLSPTQVQRMAHQHGAVLDGELLRWVTRRLELYQRAQALLAQLDLKEVPSAVTFRHQTPSRPGLRSPGP